MLQHVCFREFSPTSSASWSLYICTHSFFFFQETIMNRHSTLVHILNHVVAPYLRQLFREQWNLLYHTPWRDDANNLQMLLNVENNRRTINNLNNSGDSESWDLTALFSLLLFSDSVGIHLRNSTAHTAINSLRNIRNNASHVSNSLLMNEKAFRTRCNEIKRCLMELGYKDAKEETDDIIQERLVHARLGNDASCGCVTDVSCCTPDAVCRATINPQMKMKFWHLIPIGIIIL